MSNNFEIMDVTCRDGSYVSDFQMTLSTQNNICLGLENLGFKYVEIGHGMGLGAYRNEKYQSLHTDEEYLCCAKNSLSKIKYGVFCIPNYADLDDIKRAAEYGCSFIRIGCNVEDIDKTEKYIKIARDCNLMVASNYMKSYATSINEFKEAVKKSEFWGSELIYIVDSAGGMIEDDIKRYFDAIKSISNLKVGFHGHNNIGLALSNSIYAVKTGFDFVDCSLQGLGRSSGNTSLEYFTICLKKMGYNIDVNDIELLLLSKKYVYNLVKNIGINPIDVECGISGFHSSYLKDLHKVSSKLQVNPLELIKEYCKIDKVNFDVEQALSIAKSLKRDDASETILDFNNYFGSEQMNNK